MRLVDLDHAQTAVGIVRQSGLDQRALAAAAGAGEQDMVGRVAGDELADVAIETLALLFDPEQVGKMDTVHMRNGLEATSRALAGPAPGAVRGPFRRDRKRRQPRRELGQHGIPACRVRRSGSRQPWRLAGCRKPCRRVSGRWLPGIGLSCGSRH